MENNSEKLYNKFEEEKFEEEKLALICIDIQYHDASPGYGFFKNISRDNKEYKYYFDRLEEKVFPNVKKLQNLFREKKLEIIHVRIEALTKDGRERSLEHKRIGCLVPKGSKAAEFIPKVKPENDEIIISKTASGVFNSTNVDYILKNLGVDKIIIVGVLTNECIETAVRDAADKSYSVYLVKDGTAAFNEDLHNSTLRTLDGVYCSVIETKKLLDKLNKDLKNLNTD